MLVDSVPLVLINPSSPARGWCLLAHASLELCAETRKAVDTTRPHSCSSGARCPCQTLHDPMILARCIFVLHVSSRGPQSALQKNNVPEYVLQTVDMKEHIWTERSLHIWDFSFNQHKKTWDGVKQEMLCLLSSNKKLGTKSWNRPSGSTPIYIYTYSIIYNENVIQYCNTYHILKISWNMMNILRHVHITWAFRTFYVITFSVLLKPAELGRGALPCATSHKSTNRILVAQDLSFKG